VNTPAAAPTAAAEEESIDLGRLLAAIRRGWAVVAASAAGGLLSAAVLTARAPRIWQADFQIVLADDKGGSGLSNLLSQGGALGALLGGAAGGLAGGASSQETELKILLSPSVLLPVFEYVKSQLPPEQRTGLSLRGWAGAVGAKAAKGTSVLDVTYEGTDPALVLAASRKLAETYQSYSGRKRQRSLQTLIRYLNDQIAIYGPRAEASRARAETFANRYTLTTADAVPASGGGVGSVGILGEAGGLGSLLNGISSVVGGGSAGSLKAQQSELKRRIFDLQFQLARAQRAGDRELINMSSGAGSGGVLNALVAGSGASSASLQELDRAIAERRSRFQDNDPIVVTLQKQRRVLIGVMNRQLAQEISSAIGLAQSQLKALERPPGVVETFQQLSRDANRDSSILQNLENNLEQQKLELARDSQPWELISAPTLSDGPIKPLPRRNLEIGLLAGLISGAAGALLLERRSGLVFHTEELLELLPYPLLGQLNSSHAERWSGLLELLAHGPLQGCPQVALIPAGPLGEGASDLAQALQATLQQSDPAAQVLLSNDLLQAGRCQAQLLVAALGMAHKDELSQLQQDLLLQGRPVAGLVLLSTPQAGDDA
jgi:succinoglycan biosynthesis transport protein ExoP